MKTIKEVKFELDGLHCADCAGKIERELQKQDYIEDARVDVVLGKAKLTIKEGVDVDDEFVKNVTHSIQSIENIGVSLEGGLQEHPKDEHKGHDHGDAGMSPFIWLGGFIIALRLFMDAPWLNIVTIGVYFVVGWPVLKAFVSGLSRKQFFDENVLMSVATLGALVIGEYGEALGVMVFYSVGEYFQHKAVDDSRASIKALLNKRPQFARKLVDGVEEIVACEAVQVGDRIRINPSDQVPLDGLVVSGNTTFDMSSLTGESMPENIFEGDTILSGSINLSSPIEVEVTKEYSNSTISKMLTLIEASSDNKAKTEIFMTKFSRIYTPIVFVLALVIMLYVGITTGVAYDGIYRGLVFLVISCPCALVLSIPLGYFAGIGRASKSGILIKGGESIEALAAIDGVVFDKTGTLTKGELVVTNVSGREDVLEIAAHLESYSNHPIGKAIVNAYDKPVNLERVSEVKEVFGKGIRGLWDGKSVFVGSLKNVKEEGYDVSSYESDMTSVLVVLNDVLIGGIELDDTLREDSKQLIQDLHKRHIFSIMLSGDRQSVVDRVAKDMGIDDAYGELLPEDKVSQFSKIKAERNATLAYAGDGMNDAAVLGLSDVGFSMGAVGNDLAIEYSDVVLVNDNPHQILETIDIAKKTQRITYMNIILIMVIKILVLVLGSLGLAKMWMAVIADVGVSILAVLNAMRIMRIKR
ncbi:cadmium-translocating P-type ATPase [Erysipelothrix rhusiopathiae]|uniref:heavy metal translocating P-type ATPase n=3 Tax=Erysipelothrix rhusiopathiae TaxID=1648 RepID=UPI000210B5A7|nr:heavy metal translocating P-type ATPase [Erysipelothrix rhusiopathiae]AMS10654.1 ATPase [Erysipelothrix rhusiopathiae]AOO67004.1 cadmium-translocating P-type ATPase [Erysipelothrix rhusiopathiae]AWU41987.1 cadmium-translocating P-type ATPase [Erysipelothrix rhusiopathiae]MDE8282851.1 heavy metal translocating P-type ATPase [Erysipelothrix rhusiopathiae]MDV7678659.1 cadmium-translocating P-type ATPase [Erysipelothrix rhusiopathiae]